mmetsp:Transcript_14409/g.27068  ORF Transcript_14409/g.27068 Transcript_14409/m.27068 type:complete len:226 (+) Transcript_14409:1549-2226(+)
MSLRGEQETHLFTLDAKIIHDNKKLYTLSRIQEELSALNHQLASKNMKKIKVRGTGRNGSRLKIDFCHALVQARIAFLSMSRDDLSMPALPQQEHKLEQEVSHRQEEKQQQQALSVVPPPKNYNCPSTEEFLIETPLRPLFVHQTPKASINHFFVRSSAECCNIGSFESIKSFHVKNVIEKTKQLERNNNRNEMLEETGTYYQDDDFGALIRSFDSPFLQEALSC